MRKYRLTESRLRNIIQESVRQMINELDIMSMPVFRDSRDRDAWWKEQALNDFPGWKHKINQEKSGFQDLYYQLKDMKAQQAKNAAKKERELRKQERMQAKQERELNKKNIRKLFLHAVNYVICGEDSLMSQEQMMNDINNEIPEDWYDGVTKMPVVLANSDKPTWASIDSVGEGNNNMDAFISTGWGIDIGDVSMYIKFSVYVDPKKNQIYFEVEDVDNDMLNIDATNEVATKYLNGVIRRQFKNVAAKVERYGASNVVGF